MLVYVRRVRAVLRPGKKILYSYAMMKLNRNEEQFRTFWRHLLVDDATVSMQSAVNVYTRHSWKTVMRTC